MEYWSADVTCGSVARWTLDHVCCDSRALKLLVSDELRSVSLSGSHESAQRTSVVGRKPSLTTEWRVG
jgi:hypothetical protein